VEQAARHAAVAPQYVIPHSLPGSDPELNVVQVPVTAAPLAVEQAWQVPSHAVPQQTPSAQKLDAHWFAAAWARFVVQVPPLQ